MLIHYNKGVDGGDIRKIKCTRVTFPRLANYTKQIYEQNKDLLIIAEDLDRRSAIDYERIKEQLQPYTHIHVIVTYRRLADWFPSWYNQIVKMYIHLYVQESSQYQLPAFNEWVADQYDTVYERHTASLAQSYERHGMNVSILNYHANTSLFETMFCHTISTKNTCAAVQTMKDEGKINTATTGFEFCRVVLFAGTHHVAGATNFSSAEHCMNAGEELVRRLYSFNMSLADLPWLYPNSSLVDRMWKDTTELETAYGLVNQSGLDAEEYWTDLRSSFDATIVSKWRSVDIEKMESTGLLHRLFANCTVTEGHSTGHNNNTVCSHVSMTKPT